MPAKSWLETPMDSPGVFTGGNYSGLVYRHQEKRARVARGSQTTLEFFSYQQHFGCKDREKLQVEMKYNLCEQELPAIQAPIAAPATNGENPACDPRAPPVTMPLQVFTNDLQLSSAMYTSAAFWALPFPAIAADAGLPPRATVLLKLLVQKVLWSAGARVMLWHTLYNHITQPSTRPSDGDVILLDKINNIYCDKTSLKQCVMSCLAILLDNRLVTQSHMDTVAKWFDALTFIGKMATSPLRKDICHKDFLVYSPVDFSTPVYRKTRYSKAPYVPSANIDASSELFKDTCSKYQLPKDVHINFTHPWEQLSDVLLLVIFNNAHYEVIPYLEVMYRTFFPYMLYCGPGLPNATQWEAMKRFKVTFISYSYTPVGHFPGSFNYECVAMAMSMSYSVAGYAVMADDVLLSIANLYERKRHLVWYMAPSEVNTGDIRKLRECRLGMCDYHPRTRWWEDYKHQTFNALSLLKKGQYYNRLHHRCYNQLIALTGAEFRMFSGNADFYYVPQRLAKEFSELAILFRKEKLFLELAVPTILRCLENPEDMEKLVPLLLWMNSRNTPWLHFTSKDFKLKSFMHPTKWAALAAGSSDFQEFYCTHVLPFLHDYFGRIR